MLRTVFLVGLTVAGCAKAPPSAPTAQVFSAEAQCRHALVNHQAFKDPGSVIVRDIWISPKEPNHVMLTVSAKNSFGGFGNKVTCDCIAESGSPTVKAMHCEQ